MAVNFRPGVTTYRTAGVQKYGENKSPISWLVSKLLKAGGKKALGAVIKEMKEEAAQYAVKKLVGPKNEALRKNLEKALDAVDAASGALDGGPWYMSLVEMVPVIGDAKTVYDLVKKAPRLAKAIDAAGELLQKIEKLPTPSIPFKSGSNFVKFVGRDGKEVGVTFKAVVSNKTELVLNDIVMASNAGGKSEKLDAGARAIMELMAKAKAEAKAQGYTKITFKGIRDGNWGSTAKPGKIVDMSYDL